MNEYPYAFYLLVMLCSVDMNMREASGAQIESEHQEQPIGVCTELL
jgi:hypothetical protein